MGLHFIYYCTDHIYSYTREALFSGVCGQHRRRPACASAQSDQRLFIRFLEKIICKLAAGEISIFRLVPIAEETGLKHYLLTPPPPPPRRQVFSQKGLYDTKQSSVLRKKIPKKKNNASGFSSFRRHGRRHFFHTTQ